MRIYIATPPPPPTTYRVPCTVKSPPSQAPLVTMLLANMLGNHVPWQRARSHVTIPVVAMPLVTMPLVTTPFVTTYHGKELALTGADEQLEAVPLRLDNIFPIPAFDGRLQTQCGVNCFIMDSRRVLAPAPKVPGPKHIFNPYFAPF